MTERLGRAENSAFTRARRKRRLIERLLSDRWAIVRAPLSFIVFGRKINSGARSCGNCGSLDAGIAGKARPVVFDRVLPATGPCLDANGQLCARSRNVRLDFSRRLANSDGNASSLLSGRVSCLFWPPRRRMTRICRFQCATHLTLYAAIE